MRCSFCKLEYPTILDSVQHTYFIGVFIDYANNFVAIFSKVHCLSIFKSIFEVTCNVLSAYVQILAQRKPLDIYISRIIAAKRDQLP